MIEFDDLGEPLPLRRRPTAVVSLVPSLTEAIERTVPGVLVGATDYCVHPSTLDVERIGGSKYPRCADILTLRPDLVVANVEENRPEDVDTLRANGVPVWVTRAPVDVPDALGVLRRLFGKAFDVPEPDWLLTAELTWQHVEPLWASAIVPVWRRPWVVLGRDTFAGDVLRRVGVANAYAGHQERYPRPALDELRAELAAGRADLVVLPDEPYEFTAEDGPDAFPGARCVLLPGRYLTWWGPSLVAARDVVSAKLR